MPLFFKWLYPKGLYSFSRSKKVLYLTFDDGPIPELTPFVLAELDKYQTKATFFCVGDNICKYPAIFNNIISQNHAIGNHTFNHLKGTKCSNKNYFDNIQLCAETMLHNEFKGSKMLFRPPYGKLTLSQMKHLQSKYQVVFWDVISYDFDVNLSPENCLKNVVKNTKNGSIIVFHDNIKARKNLEYVLPRFLKYYTSKGYEFSVL